MICAYMLRQQTNLILQILFGLAVLLGRILRFRMHLACPTRRRYSHSSRQPCLATRRVAQRQSIGSAQRPEWILSFRRSYVARAMARSVGPSSASNSSGRRTWPLPEKTPAESGCLWIDRPRRLHGGKSLLRKLPRPFCHRQSLSPQKR